jgi:ribosomal protein L36
MNEKKISCGAIARARGFRLPPSHTHSARDEGHSRQKQALLYNKRHKQRAAHPPNVRQPLLQAEAQHHTSLSGNLPTQQTRQLNHLHRTPPFWGKNDLSQLAKRVDDVSKSVKKVTKTDTYIHRKGFKGANKAVEKAKTNRCVVQVFKDTS